MKKFIMSYSCGKDSTLALYRMINLDFEPAGLLVTMDGKEKKSWFHGINEEILEKYSQSLNIPVIPIYSKIGEDYGKSFEEALIEAKNVGVEICVFGDIDIEEHRKWATDRCEAAGIQARFPLWQEEREKLAYEFIDSGFKAMVKVVDLESLPLRFLGKILDGEVVQDIKRCGADPCGENGEYHTSVYDGPIFKTPILLQKKERKIKHDRYGVLEID